jgi:hypothetical protein
MTRQHCFAFACVALLVLSAPSNAAARASGSQAPADAAAAAAKASPDLVGALSKELSSTPEQAAGAAGALFGVAKSRLKPDDFAQVSKAVPGMGMLLGAAPALGAAGGKSNPLGQMAGLAAAASAFSKLGLKPELASKAIPVLTAFVTKSGGADVGKLLAGALK